MAEATENLCDAIRDDMPWKINGTLTGDELRAFDQHVAGCAACARELEAEKRFATRVQELDSIASLEAASWNRTRDAIPDQGAGNVTSLSFPRKFLPAGRPALALAASVCLAIVGIGAWQMNTRGSSDFVTLTSPAQQIAEGVVTIRVLPASAASSESVQKLMLELGMGDIGGPSQAGLLQGTVPDDRVGEVLERLRNDPQIALATSQETN